MILHAKVAHKSYGNEKRYDITRQSMHRNLKAMRKGMISYAKVAHKSYGNEKRYDITRQSGTEILRQ